LRYKSFGNTDTHVSEIGMGTYYDPIWILLSRLGLRRGKQEKIEAIRTGIEGGMNLIDTAEIYGSEPLVAEAMKGYQRDSLFIATKVWPTHLSYDDVIKSCMRSLERLSTSYIDLYQVHWPNPRIPIKETMRAMEKLVSDGKIRYIGVSNFSLTQLREAEEALSKQRISSVQNNYSLVNRSIESDLLPYCDKNNIAILAYYPLGHGKLARDKRLETFCKKYRKTNSQIALRWLAQKRNVFPIPRASRINHVNENLGASDWELSPEDYENLSNMFS
jgi:diketogulonate reductase-like aldo/keto reductase